MRFLALIFAVLAVVPQALKFMGLYFAKMNDCTLPARVCLVKDNDQSQVLNLIYGPNWFTTFGLWIGISGFIVTFLGIKIQQFVEDRKAKRLIDRSDRVSGIGYARGFAANKRR